jgi:hypothetical protein
VPPFATRQYCRTFTMPKGTRMFEMYSHTHKRGRLFQGWGPGIGASCRTATGPCAPEPETPFLVTTNYADPDVVRWNPPLALDGDDASRRFKYCATYDNGAADPAVVKRRSTSPHGLVGGCQAGETACLGGPKQGTPCGGNDAACDSSPGLGDGVCDACPVHGGVTTDDEMFIMLGSYYCVPGSDCEAALTP